MNLYTFSVLKNLVITMSPEINFKFYSLLLRSFFSIWPKFLFLKVLQIIFYSHLSFFLVDLDYTAFLSHTIFNYSLQNDILLNIIIKCIFQVYSNTHGKMSIVFCYNNNINSSKMSALFQILHELYIHFHS